MKVAFLLRNTRGYKGFLEEGDKFVYFRYSKKRGLKRLVEYDKEDFGSYERFVACMGRFVPFHPFFEKPVEIWKMDLESLDRLFYRKK